MKKKNKKVVLGIICICCVLVSMGAVACGKNLKQSSTSCEELENSSEQKEKYKVRGLKGTGYSIQTEESTPDETGSIEVEKDSEIVFTLTLDKMYMESSAIVKAGNTTLTADVDGKYRYMVVGETVITVEGLTYYQVIENNPLAIQSTETEVVEYASAMSSITNEISVSWAKYSFENIKLAPYTSVLFYMKALNGDNFGNATWISFEDNIGVFNEMGAPIYANADKTVSEKSMPDNVWHKYEFRRETDEENIVAYQLYVDNEKWINYDAETIVDARIKDRLTDFSITLSGMYYISELFAVNDPDYVEPKIQYLTIAQIPFLTEADEFIYDNLSCKESICSNVYNRMVWGRENMIDLKIEKYSLLKFYINSPDSGWIEAVASVDISAISGGTFNGGTGWHEFLIEKTENEYTLTIDGILTPFRFSKNLNEIKFTLNETKYYISELFAVEDPNYVEPVAKSVADQVFDLAGEPVLEIIADGYTKTTKYTTTWNKYNFLSFNLMPYSEVSFCVKSSGYYGIMQGDNVIDETKNENWMQIRFVKTSTGWELFYGSKSEGILTLTNNNLSDLNFRFGDNTYYVSDIMAFQDPNYVEPVYENLADIVFDLEDGVSITNDIAVGYTKTTKYTTTWNKYNFLSFDLTNYNEVRFCVKSAGYYGVMADGKNVIDETQGGGDWLEIKLVRVSTGWELFYGSKSEGILTLLNNNLNDLNFRFGENTYYISNLIGL